MLSLLESTDIAIVGAGAAGLACAIFASQALHAAVPDRSPHPRPRPRVALLDGARQPGAKILVSGGGRCNVTHDHITPDDYNAPRNTIRQILARFDHRAAAAWFESLGVTLKREPTGKLFPTTDSARTVLQALLDRCQALGVDLLADHRVQSVQLDRQPAAPADANAFPFTIHHSHGQLRARLLVLATGGRSLPRTGSDGHGWALARALGHHVTATHPALVPLVLDDAFFHSQLSGFAHEVELSLFADGRRTQQRMGSMLWTHFGISGPVVMDISRHWVIAQAQSLQPQLKCNLIPGSTFDQIEAQLVQLAASSGQRTLIHVLDSLLPGRLPVTLLSWLGFNAHLRLSQLPRDQRRQLVHAITGLTLPVVRDRGWNYAEVTAGGVPLNEIDTRTCSSRKTPGLYLVGEILDCDGRIGGFNFQWAWATGHIAGHAAAHALTA